jgi:hypothetical protein
MIPVILAAMYYYAAYVDTSAPEKTVQNFYQAYFDRDFDTVAENLSVFWAAQMMPQYAATSPQELLSKRAEIQTKTAEFIAGFEKNAPVPDNISVEILKDCTRLGRNAAVVAYAFKQDDKETSLEAAFLVKEYGKFRIYNIAAISRDNLKQVKSFDIETLDKNITELLQKK